MLKKIFLLWKYCKHRKDSSLKMSKAEFKEFEPYRFTLYTSSFVAFLILSATLPLLPTSYVKKVFYTYWELSPQPPNDRRETRSSNYR